MGREYARPTTGTELVFEGLDRVLLEQERKLQTRPYSVGMRPDPRQGIASHTALRRHKMAIPQ